MKLFKKTYYLLIISIIVITSAVFIIPVNNKTVNSKKSDKYGGNFTPQSNYDLSSSNTVDPTKWVAVDNLGRTVPANGESFNSRTVGNVSSGKQVGLFYHNWHNVVRHNMNRPMTVTKRMNCIKKYNNSLDPLLTSSWSATINKEVEGCGTLPGFGTYWWAEPVYGFYNPKDKYVVRKQIELIADAGVDFLVLDYTNYNTLSTGDPYSDVISNSVYKDELNVLFNVLDEAQADGIKTPKITFMLSHLACDRSKSSCSNTEESIKTNEETKKIVQWLYNNVYNVSSRKKHLLYGAKINQSYDSPIILAQHPSSTTYQLDSGYEALNYAHWRFMGNQYENANYNTSGYDWSWIDKYPQAKYIYNSSTGKTNEMPVSPAQHTDANPENGAIAFSRADTNGQNILGRSYAKNNYSYSYKYRNNTITVGDSFKWPGSNIGIGTLFGRNFQQQWEHAIDANSEFVMVTGWNEYLAGSFKDPFLTPEKIMFVDQYTDEYSRDLEPVNGSLKDAYYYQLVTNIRLYKGANSQTTQSTSKTINIYGNPTQWQDSNLLDYNSYTNNTAPERNVNNNEWGYGNTAKLTAVKANNDIRTAKVSYDASNIYFYVETVGNITNITKLRLLIDTLPSTTSTTTANWNEFEYVLNRNGLTSSSMKLEKVTSGCRRDELPSESNTTCEWTTAGNVNYQIVNNTLQVSIPRSLLGLTSTNINFNYKWTDNNLGNLEKMYDIMSVYTDGDAAPGGRFAYKFSGSKAYQEPTKYTITYNANGGTGTVSSQNAEIYTKVTLRNNSFTNGNKTFKNWNTKANGTGVSYNANETIVIEGNMTLYAIWEDELVFNNKTVSSTYNKTTAQTITNGVDAATNGTGTYTYTITGGNTNNYFSLSGRNIKVAANTPANTTGYAITIKAKDSNSGKTKSATYTIKVNKATATLTVASSKALTYGKNGSISYTYDGDGVVSCQSMNTEYVTCSVNTNTKKLTLTPVKITSSAIVVKLKAAAGTNYSAVSDKSINVTVAKEKTRIAYTTHVQNIGWQDYVLDGAMAGTSGKSLRLEGIKIKLENQEYDGNVLYRTHIQNLGWETSFKKNDEMSGTSGRSLRLEAIEIKLAGGMREYYDVYYRVHAENFGWLGWAKNGESAGTAGYAYRLEGIEIKLVSKGESFPEYGQKEAFKDKNNSGKNKLISYTTHVQNIGWQDYVSDGAMAGTSGKSLRLEGIKIKLENQKYDGNIKYRTHIENLGWEKEFKKNDEVSGTSGKSLRLEAIEIKLDGGMRERYDVYYRVHAENFGWLGWAKNGESAGTAGYGFRLEGIEIKLVEKGQDFPDYGKTKAFREKK